MTLLTELDGLRAADVIHPRLTSLPATATVAEVRDFFAASTSRRLAVFTDGEQFAGSIEVEAASLDGADPADAAADHAAQCPTIGPDATATEARDLALAQPSRRVPVVDGDGRLLGVVAIDKHLERFCGV